VIVTTGLAGLTTYLHNGLAFKLPIELVTAAFNVAFYRIQVRHSACTSPVCRRPAAQCDVEHNTPYGRADLPEQHRPIVQTITTQTGWPRL